MAAGAMACPVCNRETPHAGRVPFHYERTSWAPDALRVCVAVDVRTDDHRTIAQLQQARAMAVALERLTAMVATAAPMLERIAVGIEARAAAAVRAADAAERMADVAADLDDGGH